MLLFPYQLIWRIFWYRCESVSPTGDPRMDDDNPTQHLEPLYIIEGYKDIEPISSWVWLGGPAKVGTWDNICEEYPVVYK